MCVKQLNRLFICVPFFTSRMFLDHLRNSNGVDRGSRRASSRGIIPRAKIKTVKMTIVIVIGNNVQHIN